MMRNGFVSYEFRQLFDITTCIYIICIFKIDKLHKILSCLIKNILYSNRQLHIKRMICMTT